MVLIEVEVFLQRLLQLLVGVLLKLSYYAFSRLLLSLLVVLPSASLVVIIVLVTTSSAAAIIVVVLIVATSVPAVMIILLIWRLLLEVLVESLLLWRIRTLGLHLFNSRFRLLLGLIFVALRHHSGLGGDNCRVEESRIGFLDNLEILDQLDLEEHLRDLVVIPRYLVDALLAALGAKTLDIDEGHGLVD
jgi:hypothetical protein